MLDEQELRRLLLSVLPGSAVSFDAADREALAMDALGSQRGFVVDAPAVPLAAVMPGSTEEVAALVKLAAGHGLPIVPCGAGSGLMGGARSTTPGIALDLRRLDRVLEVDAASGWARVQAGAVLADVQRALDPHALILGHDPWTFPVATIGGAISTNSLGFTAGRYGSMGEQVLALEVVLADGSLLRTRAPQPRSTGIDLNRLFIGGEGQFGVITAATIRVFPRPEERVFRGYRFGSFEAGFQATLALRSAGVAPAVLDYGERVAVPPDAGLPPGMAWEDEPPTLYLGFEGFREEVEAQVARADRICRQAGGEPVDQEEVDEFWETRHAPAERFARARAQRLPRTDEDGRMRFDYVHVALPASRVLEYRELALAAAGRERTHVVETGLWVHPGLFSMVLVTRRESAAEAGAAMARAVDGCLRLAHEMDGSMEYCHGVGLRLAHLMAEEHGRGLAVMQAVKRSLDPHAILNPGKSALS